jgi:phosphatidate cytidylyltransferase
MAALAAARHDFSGALSWGQKGEVVDPGNANIHAITGDALVELGRYQEAFGEFQKAVDLKPDLATYSRGSYALELQGNVENAQRAMELALSAAASTLFGVLAIALPATAMSFLRAASPRAVLFLLLLVWVCDSCAYYAGRRFGRRPLAPVVSPKKTWEGTVAGLVGATLFGAAAGTWWFLPQLGPARGALAGALASSAGQVGDLVESLWKRGAGVKDSGVFLPGHGGFYDRIDSLLFAGPVVAAFVLGA